MCLPAGDGAFAADSEHPGDPGLSLPDLLKLSCPGLPSSFTFLPGCDVQLEGQQATSRNAAFREMLTAPQRGSNESACIPDEQLSRLALLPPVLPAKAAPEQLNSSCACAATGSRNT